MANERWRISELISQEKDAFKRTIQISKTKTFDHYDTIDKVNNYRNDEFHLNTEADTIFWNLAKPRIPHFVKKINLKPRNFRMYAKGNLHYIYSWIINQFFQKWGRESHFTLDLEDLKSATSEYGSCAMKLIDKGSVETLEGESIDKYNLNRCNLATLFFNTKVENIIESTIIEDHEMLEAQIRTKMKAWNLDEADIEHIKKHSEIVGGSEHNAALIEYKVQERHGYYKPDADGWYDEKEKTVYMRHVITGAGDQELVLYKEEMDIEECPYSDYHVGSYDGRWLRVGVYERLFNLFKRVNELVNENRTASKIASLLLFRSQEDDLTGENLINEAISGQVIDSADLEQIGITNQFLGEFLNEMLLIEKHADQLTLTPDVASTKNPDNAPVRSRILAINEINSSFETTKTRIAFKLSEVLVKRILPSLVAEWNKQDIFEIANNAEDVRIYDFFVMQTKLHNFLKEAFARGVNPSPEAQAEFIEKQQTRLNIEGRKMKVKGAFNFKYGLFMAPDDSDIDKAQMNEIITQGLAMKQGNPAIVLDPLFQFYMEFNNAPPFRMSAQEVAQQVEGQAQGGQAPQPNKPDKLLSQVSE